MSVYTTELRFVLEHYAGYDDSQDYDKVDDVIEKGRKKLFDFSYPIFDESYKSVLETKICLHYYTREIGSETAGLFKLRLKTKLNEIMPYYNKLYQSELLKFDPLTDIDLTTDHTLEREGASEDHGKTTGNRTSWNLYSDTPQGAVTGIENENYLTNATKDTDNTGGTSDNNGSFNSTDDYIEHIKGKTAGHTYAALVKELRETFLNIDMMIIEELKNLFMLVW